MSQSGKSSPVCLKFDKSGTDIAEIGEHGNVPKAERKRSVLAFLVETKLALPRKVIHRNLAHRGAKHSEGSTKNYLRELREEGFIRRIDPEAFAEGRFEDTESQSGYYIATEAGAEHIAEYREAVDRLPK